MRVARLMHHTHTQTGILMGLGVACYLLRYLAHGLRQPQFCLLCLIVLTRAGIAQNNGFERRSGRVAKAYDKRVDFERGAYSFPGPSWSICIQRRAHPVEVPSITRTRRCMCLTPQVSPRKQSSIHLLYSGYRRTLLPISRPPATD